MISDRLPLAPIQDKEGILTFSYNNHEFVIDVNEYDDRKCCLEELERISGKHFAWCKENFGLHHWVLYDMSMYYFDTISVRYKSECGLLPTIPINATSCNCMFAYCDNVDLSQFNTVNIVDMSGMFYSYVGSKLDVSMLLTGNVRDFTEMFLNCVNLRNLDVSNFNTANALIIKGMFKNCNSLKYLNLSNFSTVNVEDMSYLLCDCYELLKVDLSSFNLSNVINTVKMFCGCTVLKKIIVSDKLKFSNSIEKFNDMGKICEVLIDYEKHYANLNEDK